MKIKYIKIFFALFLLSCNMATGQFILTEQVYLDQVKKYHPVANKSQLVVSNANAELLSAKSLFDPTIDLFYDEKVLKSEDYFGYNEANIKLNTRSPISLSTGYTNNRGELINPETSTGFITYFGVNLPLLKGLMMDDRRAALAKSKIDVTLSENEQKLMINDLLFEASNQYSYWLNAYNKLNLTNRYVEVIKERMKLNTLTFINGDKSLADTIEMYTQLQSFKIQQQASLMDYVSNSIKLSSFLWNANGEPYLLSDEYTPDTTINSSLINLNLSVENSISSSPFINYYQFRSEQLSIDEKLKKQALLPVLDLNSKYYSADRSLPLNVNKYAINENYYLGLNLKYPIFNRYAKSNLEKVRIKIKENNLNRDQKMWELNTKLLQNINEWNLTLEQVNELFSLRNNLSTLLSIEELKFREGESTIFLLNSRESKLIETDIKTIETYLKLYLTYNKYRWVIAQFVQ